MIKTGVLHNMLRACSKYSALKKINPNKSKLYLHSMDSFVDMDCVLTGSNFIDGNTAFFLLTLIFCHFLKIKKSLFEKSSKTTVTSGK